MARWLSAEGIAATVCVATAYGEEVLPPMSQITVRTGRLDEEGMSALLQQEAPLLVIDATHPYATEVTKNIRAACKKAGIACLRLLRKESAFNEEDVRIFPDAEAAATWLEGQQGNILLTTGLKELSVFARAISEKSRLFARVLLQEGLFDVMEQYGLAKKQLLCMQGPFSAEMNVATLHMTKAAFLVTKESGKAGGFEEKVAAAKEAGAVCVVIGRPLEEDGYAMDQVQEKVRELWAPSKDITLAGIGMGSVEGMTVEVQEALKNADCIIGAARMLEATAPFQKPTACLYKAEEIAAFVEAHPQYRRIVIALSGDVGFYSGAKKLLQQFPDARVLCGISTVSYFAARLGLAWEEMALCSSHGRWQNLAGALRENKNVFVLASDENSIRGLAARVTSLGFGDVTMHVGMDFSYATEKIASAPAREWMNFSGEKGVYAVIFENENAKNKPAWAGIADDAFLRGQVPMTKEEVRVISLSKLQLTKEALLYDIGAGTGSVTVEAARLLSKGMVYAVEQKEEAAALIEENCRRFGCENVAVVRGKAPEALADLPAPTHAFIGGSGGNMKEILAALTEKNPAVRVVVNCIAMETQAAVLAAAAALDLEIKDLVQISTAKAKSVGAYHMLQAQNPVMIFTLQAKEER